MNKLNKNADLKKPSLQKAILVYIVVSFFLFFEMGVQVSPSVMAPHLMHALGIGAFGLGFMSSLYFYTYTAMQIPSGILFDKYNPRLIITLAILTCAVGTLLFAVSPNVYIASLARLFMGLGSAFAFVSVLVVTSDLFPSKYFATMTGITQMLAAFGAMSGQMPVSIVVSAIGWRNTMFGLAIIGGILALIVWNVLRYKRHDNHPHHVTPNVSIRTLLKEVLHNKQTWMLAIYACLLWAPMSGFASLWGVPFLVSVYHLNQHTAAFLSSLMWLGLAFASPLLGMISTGVSRRKMPLTISAFVGAIAFGGILTGDLSIWLVGVLIFVAGMACSGQVLSFSLVTENNSKTRRATAIAVNNMAVVISGAILQPLIGRMLQWGNGSIYSSHTFIIAMLSVLFAYIIAFLVAGFFIKETYCREYQEPTNP